MHFLKFPFIRSIRANLLILVSIVLVPLLVVIFYNFKEDETKVKENITKNIVGIINNLALQQKFFEESSRQLLSVLEQIPEINGKDTAVINKLLNDLLKQNPAYAALLICDNNGDLIASSGHNRHINVSDRKYYKDILSTKSFSVGEYAFSRLTSKPVIHYALPVYDHRKLKLIIIAAFDLNFYSTLFKNAYLGKNATFELLDYRGIVLYGTSNIAITPGIMERVQVVNTVKRNVEGTFENYDLSGVKRLYVYHTVSLTNGSPYIHLLIGIPVKEAYAEYRYILLKNILLWSLTAILIIIGSYLFIRRRIVRNIDLLVDNAKSIAGGDLTVRTRIDSDDGEIGILAHSFDDMAERLQKRENERNEAEDKLTALKERFELAVNSANIGIWDWFISENKLIWDENMFMLYEVDPEEFDNSMEYWKSKIDPDDVNRFESEIKNLVDEKNDYRSEFKINTIHSGVRYIRIFANVVKNEKGNPVRLIGVNWDITERKELENKLLSTAEKAETSDKLKSAFLANMSHEIRTPLNGIIGFSQLMKEMNIVPENKQQYIDMIIQSSYNLLHIVNDILDISIIESGQLKIHPAQVDINIVLDEIYNFFHKVIIREKRDKELVIIRNDSSFVQFLDKQRLLQLYNNLIGNALKFTTEGKITFGYEINGAYVKYFVKDTGIGIAQEHLTKIFDRFKQIDDGYTRTYGGTGLGLAICRSLVEIMGGKIWVESVVGEGSQFYFMLPYKDHDPNLNRNEMVNSTT